MTNIYHIAKNTWRECLRQPIFVILLICALSIIGLYPAMSLFVFRSQEKMVMDGSLATIMTFGLMTAVLCSSHTVSREIGSGTILLILSKPVSRDSFIVAKIMGILAAMTLFAWTTAIAALISLKSATDQFLFDKYLIGSIFAVILLANLFSVLYNYHGRGSFASTCAKSLFVGMTILGSIAFFMPRWKDGKYDWASGMGFFDADVCLELVLIIFAIWAMSTLATALSTRFDLASNMSICMVVFILGLMSDWIRASIISTSLSEIQSLMHSWYYLFFPLCLTFWFVTAKGFAHRKNTKITIYELHVTYAVLFLGIFVKAVSDCQVRIEDSSTSEWMNYVAKLIFAIKGVVAEVIYAILPNWQQFWLMDAVTGGKNVPVTYVGTAGGYVVAFIVSFTLLAILLFSGREVGVQTYD